MNTVAVMQPAYLPWQGYCDMLDQADLFVLLDTVPVSHQSWQTRNRIVNRQGNEVWLSIPIHDDLGQVLHTVEIDNTKPWRPKHRGTLNALSKSSLELQPLLNLYDQEWRYLTEFTGAVLLELALALGIRTPIVSASAYGLPATANPVERLIQILERAGATEYLSAAGSREVLDTDWLPIGSGSIPVRYHDYSPAPYEQNGDGFVSHLSVVDCLARHGPMETLALIRAGRFMPGYSQALDEAFIGRSVR